MRHRIHFVAFVFTTVLFFASAAAAEVRYTGEVFGSIGTGRAETGGFFSRPRHEWDINAGGGIGVRPFSPEHTLLRGLGFEFELNSQREKESGASSLWTSYTGDVLYHFRVGRTEPYALLGAGGSHRSGRTAAAGTLGTGAKIFLNNHLSLRPELRVIVTDFGLFDNIARVSVGVGYHW